MDRESCGEMAKEISRCRVCNKNKTTRKGRHIHPWTSVYMFLHLLVHFSEYWTMKTLSDS